MKIFRKSKELFLLVGSLLVSLILAELLARAFHVTPLQDRLERYAFDETLGWATKESSIGFVSSAEYSHYLFYDQDGFPTNRAGLDQSASRSTPSIALLGDSFIEGYYLPYESSLAAQLDQETELQVLNFGVSGYSPGQYLLTAREKFGEYTITDIIVFLFPYNDIPYIERDTYLGYAKPLFDDPNGEPVNLPLEVKRGKEVARSDLQGILDRLALWSLVKPVVAQFVHLEEVIREPIKFTGPEMEKALLLVRQIHLEHPDADFYVYYLPDLIELEEREVLVHNLDHFQRLCFKHGLDCIQPLPFMDEGVDFYELYLPRDRHLSEPGVGALVQHLLDEVDIPLSAATSPLPAMGDDQ